MCDRVNQERNAEKYDYAMTIMEESGCGKENAKLSACLDKNEKLWRLC